jgi:hypothetical protein
MTRSRRLVGGLCAAVLAAPGLFLAGPSSRGHAARAADAASPAAGEPTQSPNLKYYYPVKPAERPTTVETDVCVYGATPGGFTAAIQATRMGKKAVLVEFGTHVGGLTTGGLTATDGGSAAAGIAAEFYARMGTLAGFKPKPAEDMMKLMLKEAGVPVYYEHRLASVTKEGNRVTSLACENGVTFKAKMFVDSTYEGDLFAAAGTSFHVGREANAVYGETINGVQPGRKSHQFTLPVDPYVVEGDPKSGLLWGISPTGPGEKGAGDKLVQAYNFRMQFEKGGLPFPKPTAYDAKRYELLLRYMKAGGGPGVYPHPGDNNNNGAFSTDHIGFSYDWPDGPGRGDPAVKRDAAYFRALYEAREKSYQDHVNYQMGLVWFLVHDERVAKETRDKIAAWGMARHSFEETGGWPHALYVREGRRLVSDFVMTEAYCRGQKVADDSVGLAQYTMDSHNVQRYVDRDPKTGKAVVRNEGDVQDHIPGPYPVAYRAIVPKEAEAANLLVPVSLSSSHIAFGSIRMEPVFMVLGQSAATAACQAIDAGVSVQKVPYDKLKERLLADKQMLVWTGATKKPGGAAGGGGIDPAKLPGLVVDDAAADLAGEWGHGQNGQYVGDGYAHDANTDKGKKSATFKVAVKAAGTYDVRLGYTTNANRATNVPVTVTGFDGGGPAGKSVVVDEKKAPPIDMRFVSLGTFNFAAGATATVKVETAGTDGFVVVDAVQLVPSK